MSPVLAMHIAHSNYAFQVSKERGEGIAREHNISFLETSAKVMPYINLHILRPSKKFNVYCVLADKHQHRKGLP